MKNSARPSSDRETAVIDRQHQQQHEHDDREDGQCAELTVQIGAGALLHGLRDLLHFGRALVGPKHLADQCVCEDECGDGN